MTLGDSSTDPMGIAAAGKHVDYFIPSRLNIRIQQAGYVRIIGIIDNHETPDLDELVGVPHVVIDTVLRMAPVDMDNVVRPLLVLVVLDPHGHGDRGVALDILPYRMWERRFHVLEAGTGIGVMPNIKDRHLDRGFCPSQQEQHAGMPRVEPNLTDLGHGLCPAPKKIQLLVVQLWVQGKRMMHIK